MIIDSLINATRYFHLHPLFEQVFSHVKATEEVEIHTGTILLNETGLKASTVETTLREKKDAKLETHRKFIDIQIPLTHAETFGWKTAGKLYPADNAYDESNDIEFYTDAPSTYVTVSPEEFVIFFPEDAHAPLIGEGQIKKIIVKVPVV